MKPDRLNALTDGVVSIAITIMVLEIRVPAEPTLTALAPVAAMLGTYLLSFLNIALFWNNHHHMLATVERVDGRLLWANLMMLFFISLLPFTVRWVDKAGIEPWPCAAYGVVLLGGSVGYELVSAAAIRLHPGGTLERAVGSDFKGRATLGIYLAAIGLPFVIPTIAIALYVFNALLWLLPDKRIERQIDVEDGLAEEGTPTA